MVNDPASWIHHLSRSSGTAATRVKMLLVYLSLIPLFSAVFCQPSNLPGNEGGAESDNQRELLQAEQWLLRQRNADYHWGQSTALALLALTRIQSWDADGIESRLAIQKLDVDFLFQQASRNNANHKSTCPKLSELKEEDTVGRDALLTQTLASLCRNTTSYYCNNLPRTMLRSESSDYVFALELLTACGTNSYILKKHAVRLMALLDPKQWHDGDDRDDTMAMVAMATECLRYRYKNADFLLPHIRVFMNEMSKRQLADGSFNGNVVTTALSIQAMQTDSDGLNVRKNLDLAVEWLRGLQKDDGSFGNIMATAEAVIALSPLKGRINLDARCVKRFEQVDNLVEDTPSDDRTLPETKLVHVHFWFEEAQGNGYENSLLDNQFPPMKGYRCYRFSKDSVDVAVDGDASVYQILRKVNETTPNFKIKFQEFPFGQFLTSINDYEDGFPNHWIVYVVPSDVQILMQRNVDALKKYQLKTSIESAKPSNGDTVLLWYKGTH